MQQSNETTSDSRVVMTERMPQKLWEQPAEQKPETWVSTRKRVLHLWNFFTMHGMQELGRSYSE